MRIISSFKDFYDGAIDRSEPFPVWNRDNHYPIEGCPEPFREFDKTLQARFSKEGSYRNIVNRVPCYHLFIADKYYFGWDDKYDYVFYKRYARAKYTIFDTDMTKEEFKDLTANPVRNLNDAQVKWMVDNQITLMMFEKGFDRDHNTYTTVPYLKDKIHYFHGTLNAYQVAQEIERWVGGVLPEAGKEMIHLTDDMIRAKHGFDKKISFRHPIKL